MAQPMAQTVMSGRMLPTSPLSAMEGLAMETATFHEHGTFFALWLLVIFVGIEILTTARDILEPILWAFFLMMGLVPLTEIVERCIRRVIRKCCPKCVGKKRKKKVDGKKDKVAASGSRSNVESREMKVNPGEAQKPLSSEEDAEDGNSISLPLHSRRANTDLSVDLPTEEEADTEETAGNISDGMTLTRAMAVFIVITLTVGTATLFFLMVYRSALHMQKNFVHYKNGADIVIRRSKKWKMKNVPDGYVEHLATQALSSMESGMSSVLMGLVETSSHTLVQMLWVGLYMVFWLFQPFHVGREVSTVFRHYIFLKGIASSGYAFCVWILLHCIGVDLAIVFGLITFVFNFIPEIGPFFAMVLPLPVILFDDRIEDPVQYVLLAFLGQMALKVVFGNIVEIKLIESQQEMRMHPVVILFFVAFFQFIWGATGMLLSVPIVAALKALLHKIPPNYRDGVLIFLEGDVSAPDRWQKWRDKLQQDGLLDSP